MATEIGPISPARLIQILNALGLNLVPINVQLVAILAQLDVALSTRASEATIAALLAQLQAVLAKMDSPADPMVTDVTDRWARLLGQIDLARVLGAALSAANPVIAGIYDAAGNRVELDSVEPVMPTIEFEHHMVHDGQSFTCDDYDSEVDIAAPKYWHIITPNTLARVHIKMTLISDTPGLAEFFENPTTTGNGVALTIYNNDRNSTVATTALIYRDPTVTLDGARLAADLLGTNNPKTRFGGATREQAEWIFKQNEQYLLKFTTDANDARVAVQIEYYEIPPP